MRNVRWLLALSSSVLLASAGCVVDVDSGGGFSMGGSRSGLVISSDHVSAQPVHVSRRPGTPGETCTGTEASRTFTSALCVCGDLGLAGSLSTGSFDATAAVSEAGGAVGVNGELDVAGTIDVGSLAVGRDVGMAGAAEIHGDARVDGGLGLAGVWHVYRDAWIGGDIGSAHVAGRIVVDRDLVQPPGASQGRVEVHGQTVAASFELPDPCPCDPSVLVPVDAIVAEASILNDDALHGVDPSALDGIIGQATAQLPSGRVYLTGISGAGEVVLVARGRTAVFVDGDVSLAGSLTVRLAGDGELDQQIAGDFDVAGSVELGDASRPHATRLWLGGGGEIGLAGQATLFGDLYAPRATLSAAGDLDIAGAAFVGEVDLAGSLSVQYDRAVLDAGDACDLPEPTSCTTHLDCAGGQACVAGACGACSTDADCGCGLVCDAGTCGALLL